MSATTSSSLDRRDFLASSAAIGAITAAASLLPAKARAATEDNAIRPFRVGIPEDQIVDLRRRLAATRWPDQETVADESQGVQLATIQDLVRYWQKDYDWRKCEAKLNALPQFTTMIDGLDIHFIHVRSKHEKALPLIVTHGWPGSVIEQLKIIDPLTNPTAHGASASDAFHLVIPSLPGFGFSGKPTTTGWNTDRTARAWVVLMNRLGYTRFVSQGGDLGAGVCTVMAKQAPAELLGIHTNFPGTIPPDMAAALQAGDPPPSGLLADEKRAYEQLKVLFAKRRAYAQMMATRPQTLYGLADSPTGLAAWLFDHGDGYGQPAAAITSAVVGRTINGHPAGELTRDDVLDDFTLYWLTNTAISAARFYWENKLNLYNAANVSIPAAVSIFPGENYQAPRSWTERAYHKLIYFNNVDEGGHYAAWEQPKLFSAELRGVQITALIENRLNTGTTCVRILMPHTATSIRVPLVEEKMSAESNQDRRRFLGTAAMTFAAAQLSMASPANAQSGDTKPADLPKIKPGTNMSFGPLKQIDAGALNVGYAEAGPTDGPPVVLLHGWPYDIHSFVDVAPLLASKGYRVIVPYLRGYGSTRFLSTKTVRNGQQSVVALDIVALMDALKIEKATIGGFDWGARTANIIAALWPERCKAMVSVSGYLIGNQEAGKIPLPPKAELEWWYQYYFATERGRAGYDKYRNDFAKLIWKLASPKWNFDDATFNRSAAAFNNPDHVSIVIHNYRWRLGLAEGEPKYDSLETRLAKAPVITVPTITLEGDANGAPHPDGSSYAAKFSGKYAHRIIKGGVGHNLPQEAPQAFAEAVVEVDGY